MSGPPGGPVDTIVAAASAPGAGERAIVRLSGQRAHELAAAVLAVEGQLKPGAVGRGRLDLGGDVGLEVLLLPWRAPRSLTGEDVLEIHLLGWPVLVTELVRRLVAAGARPARRGEFMRRAVVTGRVGLGQALAVARLVEAADLDELAAAAAALATDLARAHDELVEQLLSTLALIEAHVDFEEQDTEAVGEAELRTSLGRALALARALAAASAAQPAVDGETDIVLLGPPNAGKSSLFLALCPGAETTVSPVPGTTRDALEARVEQGGRRFRVLDGPGIAPDVEDTTPLDRRAMELFLRNLPVGAVVLHVEDLLAPSSPAQHEQRLQHAAGRPVVEVRNKLDLAPAAAARESGAICVSARDRTGLPALWAAVHAAAPLPREPDVATAAEREAAAEVVPLLVAALERDLAGALPVLSLEVREALARLAAEREQAPPLDEQVLDRIFARFCIGK